VVKSKNPKKRKPKREHPIVTALRQVYKDQIGIRELVIDEMYDEALDIAAKNAKTLRDYIQ